MKEEDSDWSVFPPTVTGAPISPKTTPRIATYKNTRKETIADLVQQGYWVKATGSRVTKDGWTEHSDWDYAVFDPDKSLKLDGWVIGGSESPGQEWTSYRLGETNLIVVNDDPTWKKYIIATNLIKAVNAKTKKERIALFDSVFGRDMDSRAVSF
jgi:hypothetical protein